MHTETRYCSFFGLLTFEIVPKTGDEKRDKSKKVEKLIKIRPLKKKKEKRTNKFLKNESKVEKV